jgi:site-specific DNA-methyltransferase (adenine-specific)
MQNNYNPDVLSCLANLSSDEVFTPPKLANEILDLLPKELWKDKNATFLDPVCKSGVFLREIAKRLLEGLKMEIPDVKKRIDHIYKNQLFGMGITELTSLLSRRSVYCSKTANGKYSVSSSFNNDQGNISFEKTDHNWKNGRCSFCGASQSEYERDEGLETHAYQFIHNNLPDNIKNMKFDVIIGNPPYQLSDGGEGASAVPIYQKFVEQAKKLNPRFLTMIIPARWFVGGRGLDDFRKNMLQDDRIRVIHDYPNASDCFSGVEIKGGVMYFLWNRDNHGPTKIHSHVNNQVNVDTRALLEEGMGTFIRDSVGISIIKKIKKKNGDQLSSILKAGRHFGFHTKVEWNNDGTGKIQTADGQSSLPISRHQTKDKKIKVYIAHGEGWISDKSVVRSRQDIDKYKAIIPRSGNPGGTIIGKPKVSEPGSCSSNTYIVALLDKNNLKIIQNLLSYLKTKFVRYLLSLRTTTQDMAPKSYDFVPMQDFSETWSDKKLYKKYKLTKEEIEFIESMIRPMN